MHQSRRSHGPVTSGPRTRRPRRAVVMLGTVTAVLAVLTGPARADDLPLQCGTHQVHVAMSDGGPQDRTIVGQLCYRGPVLPRTVQLLVHGSSYNHLYWDFPYQNSYYSYVGAATLAGYATFNIDRLGAGESSHPSGLQLDMTAGAVALHNVISKLRSGDAEVGGHAFEDVVWVGHSLGSFYGWAEVAAYHDVDALILTGALHASSPSWLAGAFAASYPASEDPLFAGRPGVDWSLYVTSRPGTRGGMFYYAPTTDPQVVAVDEQNKDTVAVGELPGLSLPTLPPDQAPSRLITVPVLVVVGANDGLYCAPDALNCSDQSALQQYEASYYSPQAQLQVVVLPQTGHDLNLHLTAPAGYVLAQAWALTHVPPWA